MSKINLVLEEKEAIVLHMVYSIGAQILAKDNAILISHFATNVSKCLEDKYTKEEKAAIARKITNVANAVSKQTLYDLGIVLKHGTL